MELLTASYRTWRPGAGSPVVASLTTPRWKPEAATWPRCREIAPSWRYFHAPPDDFEAEYVGQLERYGVDRIMRRLAEIGRDAFAEPSERLCLICWEQDPAECHRGTFASWLLAQTGELVKEVAQ